MGQMDEDVPRQTVTLHVPHVASIMKGSTMQCKMSKTTSHRAGTAQQHGKGSEKRWVHMCSENW